MRKRVYYKTLTHVPAFNLNRDKLWIYERATHQLQIISFSYNDCVTITTEKQVELPAEITIRKDPTHIEAYR